ncbi:MAG: hypothetical protein DRI46_07980 [Chloroflexi bacterium]|nr:MAG: hypothetical protein DRI46_07980 [Chloroflexota bacterium]
MDEIAVQESIALMPIGTPRIMAASNGRGLIVPDDITWEEAEDSVSMIYAVRGLMTWALMDLFFACERQWGEAYTQLIDETQLTYGHLANMATVYRRFPTPEHRRWAVSPSHYAAVTRKDISDTDVERLLNAAEREKLSVAVVKGMIRGMTDERKIGTSFSGPMFVQSIETLINYLEKRNIELPIDVIEPLQHYLEQYTSRVNRGKL